MEQEINDLNITRHALSIDNNLRGFIYIKHPNTQDKMIASGILFDDMNYGNPLPYIYIEYSTDDNYDTIFNDVLASANIDSNSYREKSIITDLSFGQNYIMPMPNSENDKLYATNVTAEILGIDTNKPDYITSVEKIKEKNAVAYNALMTVFLQIDNYDKFYTIFHENRIKLGSVDKNLTSEQENALCYTMHSRISMTINDIRIQLPKII